MKSSERPCGKGRGPAAICLVAEKRGLPEGKDRRGGTLE